MKPNPSGTDTMRVTLSHASFNSSSIFHNQLVYLKRTYMDFLQQQDKYRKPPFLLQEWILFIKLL